MTCCIIAMDRDYCVTLQWYWFDCVMTNRMEGGYLQFPIVCDLSIHFRRDPRIDFKFASQLFLVNFCLSLLVAPNKAFATPLDPDPLTRGFAIRPHCMGAMPRTSIIGFHSRPRHVPHLQNCWIRPQATVKHFSKRVIAGHVGLILIALTVMSSRPAQASNFFRHLTCQSQINSMFLRHVWQYFDQ